MVNIVLQSILFQPFEYQDVYIRPFEMLLSNQRRPAQRLQFRYQRHKYIYIYTPLLFRVLSTTIAASSLMKITFTVRQGFLPA